MTARLAPPPKAGWLAYSYYGLSWLLWLCAPLLLYYRVWLGKEDKTRLAERRGYAAAPRPQPKLIWAHAVSLGEGMALLPLLHQLADRHHVLLTTITKSSADLLSARLPDGVRHHYAPLDTPPAVARFLNHWQPDLALFAESEWWPNLLWQMQARAIPAVLVNARLSQTTLRNWQRAPAFARSLLNAFDLVLAQDEHSAARLAALGVENKKLTIPGNLKEDAPPLPVQQTRLHHWQTSLAGRPCLLAASTHPQEETMLADVHQQVAKTYPKLLTMIAPRHPSRAPAIARQLRAQGLTLACRSASANPPSPSCQFFLADSFGELGLWMRLAQLVFIGGSLVPHGGQNPLEAAKLGRPVLFGPHMDNFTDLIEPLLEAGAAQQVKDGSALAELAEQLLGSPETANQMGQAGLACAAKRKGALARSVEALQPFLPSPSMH